MPWLIKCNTTRSNIGRPATLIIGLGIVSVMGYNLVPFPPAMMTAQFANSFSPIIESSKWIPERRPPLSIIGTWRILRACIKSSTSARLACSFEYKKFLWMWSFTGCSSVLPDKMALRTSPSESTPCTFPTSSTTTAKPSPDRSIDFIASKILTLALTQYFLSSLAILRAPF